MYILETIYDDYDITYQTSINENIIPILILLGILAAFIVIYFISMIRIYRKANRSGISAIVPIYNCAVLMEIINEPKWKFLLLLIPIFNIVYFCICMYRLAKYFRKGEGFCVLTAIFPLFLIPVIAFGSSEYIGINEEAMRGVSVAKDIPVETAKKPDISKPDQPLKERTKVNMSIGGGVYQKEYRDSMLEAKNIKETSTPGIAGFRVESEENAEVNQAANPNEMNLIQNVAFVETNNNNNNTNNNEPNVQIESAPAPSALTIELPQIEVPQTANEIVSISTPEVTPVPIENATVSLSGTIEESAVSLPDISMENNTPSSVSSDETSQSPMNILLASNSVDTQTPSPNLVAPVTPTTELEPKNSLLESTNNTQNAQDVTPSPSEEFINCPHCGAKIRSESKKCFMCGNEL